MTLRIVQDEAADELLSGNAFALLCGMLLQQQVPIAVAFSGPAKIFERLGSFDPATVEAVAAEDFAKLCATEPAIHPYPESMSVLIQAVARFVVANYAGDTASLWQTAGSGEHLLSRLMLLPGFSKRQAQMFIALLGKQLDVRPPGWEQAAGQFAKADIFRSVADVRDAESLEKVQTAKSKGSSRGGDADDSLTTSPTTTSSKGSGHVTMQEDSTDRPEDSEERAARKAARKAAKRAANRTGQGGDGKGTGTGKRADAKTGERAAAKKAAKRAARREARALDPDAPAKKGGGRNAEGRRANRERREREQSEAGGGDDATRDGSTDELSDDMPDASGVAESQDSSEA